MSAASQRLADLLKELATITSGHFSSAQTRRTSDTARTDCELQEGAATKVKGRDHLMGRKINLRGRRN